MHAHQISPYTQTAPIVLLTVAMLYKSDFACLCASCISTDKNAIVMDNYHVMLLAILHSFSRFTARLHPDMLNASSMCIANHSGGDRRWRDDTDRTGLSCGSQFAYICCNFNIFDSATSGIDRSYVQLAFQVPTLQVRSRSRLVFPCTGCTYSVCSPALCSHICCGQHWHPQHQTWKHH